MLLNTGRTRATSTQEAKLINTSIQRGNHLQATCPACFHPKPPNWHNKYKNVFALDPNSKFSCCDVFFTVYLVTQVKFFIVIMSPTITVKQSLAVTFLHLRLTQQSLNTQIYILKPSKEVKSKT